MSNMSKLCEGYSVDQGSHHYDGIAARREDILAYQEETRAQMAHAKRVKKVKTIVTTAITVVAGLVLIGGIVWLVV